MCITHAPQRKDRKKPHTLVLPRGRRSDLDRAPYPIARIRRRRRGTIPCEILRRRTQWRAGIGGDVTNKGGMGR